MLVLEVPRQRLSLGALSEGLELLQVTVVTYGEELLRKVKGVSDSEVWAEAAAARENNMPKITKHHLIPSGGPAYLTGITCSLP